MKKIDWVLLRKKVDGNLNNNEKVLFEEWHKNKSNKVFFVKMEQHYSNLFEPNDIDKEYNWNELMQKLKKRKLKKHRIRVLKTNMLKIASIIVLSLIISSIVYFSNNEIRINNTNKIFASIKPGSKKAELILEDGKKIILDGNNKSIVTNNLILNSKGGKLNYKTAKIKKNRTFYNTIYIPVGGEYSFVLSDGTKVWLNSLTKIRYPVQFSSKTPRVIEIEGEAYFEVAKDLKRKFIVKTAKAINIEVLGTHFNVKSYPEDAIIETTLLEGKVKVKTKNKEKIITPNQQVIYNKKSQSLQKINVDAKIFSAWKDGKFIFEKLSLEEIMIQLERWYDIKVFFMNDAVKNYHFTGNIERYSNFEKILKIIKSSTNINFEINKNTIIIRE